MSVNFGHLYQEVIELEQAVSQLERDVQNASCDYATKCILQQEWESLDYQLNDLMESEFDFENIDIIDILESVQRCISCVNIEPYEVS